jgi:hypothetical protein
MFCSNCGQAISDKGNFCHHCGNKTHSKELQKVDPATEIIAISQPMSEMSVEEYEKRKKRNEKIGLLWLITPIATLFAVLFVYAIISFVDSALVSADTGYENNNVVVSIIKVVLSLFGVAAIVGIIIGVPLGIIYLNKRDNFSGMKFDARSGKGKMSEIPIEISGWSWGAAGLTWIWGASHRVWISFLVFIPFVNFFFWIYLGIKGNELAWRADKWESVGKFLETERKWKLWGIIFFILGVLLTLSGLANNGN